MRLHHAFTLPATLLALAAGARPAAGQDTLANPPNVYSQGGVLSVTMQAAPATYTLFGQQYTNNLYAINDYPPLYAPPTLRLNPGDSVSLVLSNGMSAESLWTNLHYHGFNVTPVRPGDNVVSIVVDSGTSFTYGFRLPTWHPSGMFWYHPHPHGISEPQVLGGMSGAIIVGGLLDNYPQWQGIPERVMLLKDFVNPLGDSFPKLKTINGQSEPSITLVNQGPELWRLANVGADAFFNLKIAGLPDGATPFYIIARDGNPTDAPIPADSLFIPPSSRVEAIVMVPMGAYVLYTDFVDTGPAGDPNPVDTLAYVFSTLFVDATAASTPATPATHADSVLAQMRALAANMNGMPVDTIVFSENVAGDTFYIGGKMYDPDVIDRLVEVPSVQAWLIQNTTGEVHVFHIHQTDFAVVSVNGQTQPIDGLVDTVNLPYQPDSIAPPGEVMVLINFQNPIIEGEFVYHCHILEHEDGGMMANIYAYYPGGTTPVPRARTRTHRHP